MQGTKRASSKPIEWKDFDPAKFYFDAAVKDVNVNGKNNKPIGKRYTAGYAPTGKPEDGTQWCKFRLPPMPITWSISKQENEGKDAYSVSLGEQGIVEEIIKPSADKLTKVSASKYFIGRSDTIDVWEDKKRKFKNACEDTADAFTRIDAVDARFYEMVSYIYKKTPDQLPGAYRRVRTTNTPDKPHNQTLSVSIEMEENIKVKPVFINSKNESISLEEAMEISRPIGTDPAVVLCTVTISSGYVGNFITLRLVLNEMVFLVEGTSGTAERAVQVDVSSVSLSRSPFLKGVDLTAFSKPAEKRKAEDAPEDKRARVSPEEEKMLQEIRDAAM